MEMEERWTRGNTGWRMRRCSWFLNLYRSNSIQLKAATKSGSSICCSPTSQSDQGASSLTERVSVQIETEVFPLCSGTGPVDDSRLVTRSRVNDVEVLEMDQGRFYVRNTVERRGKGGPRVIVGFDGLVDGC